MSAKPEIARIIDPEIYSRLSMVSRANTAEREAIALDKAEAILALPPLPQQGDIAQRESGGAEPVAWWTRGMYGNNQWGDWDLISEARAERWKLDPSYKNGRRQVEPLYAAPPASQAPRQVDPETIGDVSSLIAARCVALPGALVDCPVCGAVDKERERLASEGGAEAQARVDGETELRRLEVDADLEIIDGVAALMAQGQLTQPRKVGAQIRKTVRQIRAALLSGSTPKPAGEH